MIQAEGCLGGDGNKEGPAGVDLVGVVGAAVAAGDCLLTGVGATAVVGLDISTERGKEGGGLSGLEVLVWQ